jgi:hypothetical protein
MPPTLESAAFFSAPFVFTITEISISIRFQRHRQKKPKSASLGRRSGSNDDQNIAEVTLAVVFQRTGWVRDWRLNSSGGQARSFGEPSHPASLSATAIEASRSSSARAIMGHEFSTSSKCWRDRT